MASKPNDTELRIKFTNSSFIKLDGADNVETYRGVKPRGLIILDEFKDFRPEFYDAFDPNRAAHDIPIIIIGTPPERDGQYVEKAKLAQSSKDWRYFHAPSYQNPHLSRSWLAAKKDELYSRGEPEVWEREYEAKFVKGGSSAIFPMLKKEMVKSHSTLMSMISRDVRKLQWFLWADPAAASCFAVLLCAINPYTKDIYFLDEIYETSQQRMSVKQIGGRIFEKRNELFNYPAKWRQGYDEAETWFANEALDNFQEYFEPSSKATMDKDAGLSLIKDVMLAGKFHMSDRCVKFYWELDNYMKDKNGKIPKLNDHLIDCCRYILNAASYELNTKHEHHETDDPMFRGEALKFRGDDWTIEP